MERPVAEVGRAESAPMVAMLLGGFDPPSRSADIAAGRRPTNDVEALSAELGAVVYDFGWLERGTSRSQRLLARWARRTRQWSAALALATALEVRSADVVYVSGEDVAVVACAVSRLLPGRSPRWIVRVERPLYGRTPVRRWLHRRAMRFAGKAIDLSLCRTNAVGEHLRSHLRIPEARVATYGQEIDIEFFDPATPPLARPPCAPSGQRYVLSGGLERRDYDTLFAAVDGLAITLVVAAGSPWSKEVFDTDRDVPENVVVGSFGPLEMRELYRRAAAVVLSVHPTERACGMNVVGEAFAMARPVVATATVGLSEYIVDGETGLLVRPGDPLVMRAAIRRVLADDRLAIRLGDAGRRDVCDRLALDRFVETV
ncbi:MAG: glycosyltransferase family 4 protein, partial [Ilumatobacteraceae bacterium]